MSKKGSAHSQDLLKYQKLYNWCRTLITSGVIKNKDKFPSENILAEKVRLFQTDCADGAESA